MYHQRSDLWAALGVVCRGQSGATPLDSKRGLFVHIWKGKRARQNCYNYHISTLVSVPGKVRVRLLLIWIRSPMLQFQRPEQSWFTSGTSTIDRVLAIHVLVERRSEFRPGLLEAYGDLKTFNSVPCEALLNILRISGIPPSIIDLITRI